MQIAIVGTGYVADFYMQTMVNHANLRLRGVFDRDQHRQDRFTRYYRVHGYPSLEGLLADPAVEMVLNLTNPSSHYAVTSACLDAGKHVYSEKPLAVDLGEARELIALAASLGLRLAAAPCCLLGETAQTLWRALRQGMIGRAHLAYAELDDGMLHTGRYRNWISASGAPWPYRDEFETGCTFEHAAYAVELLAAFFGPVRRITAFSTCLIPDKLPAWEQPLERVAPDFSVGVLEFDQGVVARLTNSIVAPVNRSLTLVGDTGSLFVTELWDYAAPVRIGQMPNGVLGRALSRVERYTVRSWPSYMLMRRVPLVRNVHFTRPGAFPMDFMRGPAEVAEAVATGRPSRLTPELALHLTEVAIALQYPERSAQPYEVSSTFEPIEPMPWGA